MIGRKMESMIRPQIADAGTKLAPRACVLAQRARLVAFSQRRLSLISLGCGRRQFFAGHVRVPVHLRTVPRNE